MGSLGALQTLVAFVFSFGMLVFFHELGHFTVAKAAGIRVEEFALGIGARIASLQRGETRYSLRWIPLGGFVKLVGMDDEDGVADPRKSVLVRLATVAAGPIMNLVLALFLFSVVFGVIGIPAVTVADVSPNSPAYRAGLHRGDVLVRVSGETIDGVDKVISKLGSSAGHTVGITVSRAGHLRAITVVPEYDKVAKVGRIGVSLGQKSVPSSPGRAIVHGFKLTGDVTKGVAVGLVDMLTGRSKAEVTGPIGIFGMVGSTARMGFISLLFLVAILSVNLAVVNLLPIPVLDGGWILFLVLEGIMGRPLKPEQRGVAQLVGVALLMSLFLFASYADLARLSVFERLREAVQGWF